MAGEQKLGQPHPTTLRHWCDSRTSHPLRGQYCLYSRKPTEDDISLRISLEVATSSQEAWAGAGGAVHEGPGVTILSLWTLVLDCDKLDVLTQG